MILFFAIALAIVVAVLIAALRSTRAADASLKSQISNLQSTERRISLSLETPCRCRLCEHTKTIAGMAVCSFKRWGEWTGVCTVCFDFHCGVDASARLAAARQLPLLGVNESPLSTTTK